MAPTTSKNWLARSRGRPLVYSMLAFLGLLIILTKWMKPEEDGVWRLSGDTVYREGVGVTTSFQEGTDLESGFRELVQAVHLEQLRRVGVTITDSLVVSTSTTTYNSKKRSVH